MGAVVIRDELLEQEGEYKAGPCLDVRIPRYRSA